MIADERSISIIQFLEKKQLGEIFQCLVIERRKGNKKLLVRVRSTFGLNKFPNPSKYKDALEDDTEFNKKIVKLGESNEQAY